MKDYLRSDEVKKRHDVECSTHSERMLTLCRYTNLLHGTTPAFTGPEVKEIVFKSFPFSWQQDYELSGRDFNAQQLSEIVDYFGTLKVKKDQDETRKGHGGGRGSPGRGGFEHILAAAEFRKGIKRDKSHYKEIKNEKQWDNWKPSTISTVYAHGCENILSQSYVPATPCPSWCLRGRP